MKKTILFMTIILVIVGVILISFNKKMFGIKGNLFIKQNKAFSGKLIGPLQEADFIFDLPEGIRLGEVFTDFLKEKLGQPLKVDEYYDDDHVKVYYYHGFQIRTFAYDEEIICMYAITGKGIKTNRGLMIGDNKDKIIEKYGEPQKEVMEVSGKDISYEYYFETELENESYQRRYIYFTLSISTKEVKEIVFVEL